MALLKKLNWAPAKISEHILLEKAIASLSDSEREDFEERVAIMEYDGCMSREKAERLALECVLNRREEIRKEKF